MLLFGDIHSNVNLLSKQAFKAFRLVVIVVSSTDLGGAGMAVDLRWALVHTLIHTHIHTHMLDKQRQRLAK